ncbi:hypothetical protein N0V90_000065 [Kalmusia sp. IMI 367209]|nr:hypothetical protein N0V90_000065 [Kalmusia sp. IMI 367209]
MERDTHLTFRDIHGTLEAFSASIQDIERTALVKASDDAPLQPRFLTPRSTTSDCVDFCLTEPDQYKPEQDFISVSYTWTHSQSTADLNIPDYRIWESNKTNPRRLRCPPAVFHRALQYARTKSCAYIWIDQECINQDDATDIENHLQIMHRIYQKSRWTIAVLSCSLSNEFLLSTMVRLLEEGYDSRDKLSDMTLDDDDEPLRNSFNLIPGDRQERYRQYDDLLNHIFEDLWFTRTWTFHEKLCAKYLVFLIPISPPLRLQPNHEHLAVDNDISFGADMIETLFSKMPVRFFWKRYRMVSNLTNPIRTLPRPLARWNMYRYMEKCDNLVVSDRLAIFANICGFEWKLKSTLLDTSQWSYSTCLLVLLVANTWPSKADRDIIYRKYLLKIWNGETWKSSSEPDAGTFMDAFVLPENAWTVDDE